MLKIRYILLFCLAFTITSCKQTVKHYEVIPVKEHFIYGDKIYRISGDEVKLIAELSGDSVKTCIKQKIEIKTLAKQEFKAGNETLYVSVKLIYRNNNMYYKVIISDSDELWAKFKSGSFRFTLFDTFGFKIFENSLPLSDFRNNEYAGKSELNIEDFKAVEKYEFIPVLVKKAAIASWSGGGWYNP